jgi:uncharacterized protein YkwD
MIRAKETILVLCLGLSVAAVAVAQGTATPPAAGKNAAVLASDFARPNATDEQRRAAADALLGMGTDGAQKLERELDLFLKKREAAYLQKYAKAVKAVLDKKPKLDSAAQGEVRTLRQKMAQLRALGDKLTKEEVVKEGDPAMARLAELLYVAPDEVARSVDDALRAERAEIASYDRYMDRCRTALAKKPEANAADLPDTKPATVEQDLARLEMLACVREIGVRFTVPAKDLRTLQENEKLTPKIDALEALGILDLNRMRLLLGQQALAIDLKLCLAARDHCNDMRTKNFFAHESPVPGKKLPWDRARRAGTVARAENIANGQSTPQEVTLGWFHSPGHHVNMLNPGLSVMGLGRSCKHWTQMFR